MAFSRKSSDKPPEYQMMAPPSPVFVHFRPDGSFQRLAHKNKVVERLKSYRIIQNELTFDPKIASISFILTKTPFILMLGIIQIQFNWQDIDLEGQKAI